MCHMPHRGARSPPPPRNQLRARVNAQEREWLAEMQQEVFAEVRKSETESPKSHRGRWLSVENKTEFPDGPDEKEEQGSKPRVFLLRFRIVCGLAGRIQML